MVARLITALAHGAFCERPSCEHWRVERPKNSIWNRRPSCCFFGWQRWPVERPKNSVWNRPPSRCFLRAPALARGESQKFRSEFTTLSLFAPGGSERCLGSTTLSLFSTGGSAGAWSVLGFLLRIDDPLAVCCGWQLWHVERPRNSAWNR